MKTNIVSIGNSQGVRIPKILLEQSKLSGEVELEVCGESIIIKPARKAARRLGGTVCGGFGFRRNG